MLFLFLAWALRVNEDIVIQKKLITIFMSKSAIKLLKLRFKLGQLMLFVSN